MSDYKIEVEQVVSENTERLIPNETEGINMNTPEDSDTEIEASGSGQGTESNESRDRVRNVLDSVEPFKTNNNDHTNIEYLSKEKFETILGEMRKDMLQVVNVAQIATSKTEQNEKDIERLRRSLMGYENTINMLSNNVRQLTSELRDVKLERIDEHKQTKTNKLDSDNSESDEQDNEQDDEQETEQETETSITEINDSQSNRRAKVFKITPKRKLSTARDVIGNLEEKEEENTFTSNSRKSRRNSTKTKETESESQLSGKEYRRRRKR